MIRLVMTGGPCGGKTTAMPLVAEALEKKGYKVFMVPEVPTTLLLTGVHPGEELSVIDFENLIMDKQIHDEKTYTTAATHWKNSIVVYDRALPDILPFVGEEEYTHMLEARGITRKTVYDRYDIVIHLTSAAVGAEEFYEWNDPKSAEEGNNKARYTTLERAKLDDEETMYSWSGHDNLRVIDNSTGFEEKMKRLLAAVDEMVDAFDER